MTQLTIQGGGDTDPVALVSLVISLFALCASWYWSSRAEKRSYLDQFWFREVMAPGCFRSVMKFRDDTISRLNACVGQKVDGEMLKRLVNEAQVDVAAIIDSMWVAKIFRGKFYRNGSEAIQKVEDILAESLGKLLGSSADFRKEHVEIIGARVTQVCLHVLNLGVKLHSTRLRRAPLQDI